jgi:hypothetical protein
MALPATDDRLLAADRVPTLTEVVELGREQRPAAVVVRSALPAAAAQPLAEASAPPEQPAPPAAPPIDEAALVARVLAELEPRLDRQFETRLRLAASPALTRAAQAVVRELRQELSATLRDLVQEAVTQAIERRDGE